MKLHLFTNVTVVDDARKFVSDKSSSIKPELEKHKVDDAVTVDKKHSNDIQGPEVEDVRHVSERYIAKSDPYIVMVSTPNALDGLFEHMEKEDEETCIYKRLLLDYTYGL